MLSHHHATAVVGFVTAAGWTARLRWALPALLLGVAPGALHAASATQPAAVERELPPAPALVAEVEPYEGDAAPAAASARRGPSTRPAEAADRGDRTERRRPMGNLADMRELDAYLTTPRTARAADDPYRLTDPLLYLMPWGHPAPPPYPPPPLPTRNPYAYGSGAWYDSSGGSGFREVPRSSGGPGTSGPVRTRVIVSGPGGAGAGPPPIALPPSPRAPLPPGVPIPRARPPQLRPGT